MKHWTPDELKVLRGLRERFLTGTAGHADYWRSAAELELYDRSFGERIGWKWDAVLRELTLRGWSPQSRRVLDWGCGSGVASRRVLDWIPEVETLALHDRSPLAMRFATEKARALLPQVTVARMESIQPGTLLLLSHVISELSARDLDSVCELALQAREIIWVEAGTHADSRRLSEVRDRLLPAGFHAIAPCTHQARCGMLAPKNARHWCHHFGAPPPDAFQNARWAEFGKELGIDLRSLPYSFLVLSREPAQIPPEFSRIIGVPRDATGYSKVLSCHESGVNDLLLQKRDAPDLLREVRKGPELPLYHWKLAAGKITGAEPFPPRE